MTTNNIEICFTKEQLEEEFRLFPGYPIFFVKDTDASRRLVEKMTRNLDPGRIIMLELDEYKALKIEAVTMRLS